MNYLLSAFCVPSNLLSTSKSGKDEKPPQAGTWNLTEEIRHANTKPLEENRRDYVLESLCVAGRRQEVQDLSKHGGAKAEMRGSNLTLK